MRVNLSLPADVTSPWRQVCRSALLGLLGMLLTLSHGLANAQDPHQGVRLDARQHTVELWGAVRMLAERGDKLTPQQALNRAATFEFPETPQSNLGVRLDAVWLHVELDVSPDAPENWIFDVDYPSIDRIDLYHLMDGAVAGTTQLGDELLIHERPRPSRSHAVELVFRPGYRHALLMRIQSTSSMILPLTLTRPLPFQKREAGKEALQGLFAGIGICLLIYSLAHWVALRDRVFAYYGTAVAGTTLFFLAYNGLAPEHIWPNSRWLTANAAPISVLVALAGGFFFLECILRVAELNKAVSRLMSALAWIALAAATAFMLGLINYRTAQVIGTVLGPLPMILGLPIAYLRMRQGEGVMFYLFAGWGLYVIGIAIMAALLRGLAPANTWTQHAFQIGSTLEMALWLVLLGQRVEQTRRIGEQDHREHAALRSLALSDALTGLPNRRGLETAMADAVRRSCPERMAAVFMIDLDGFKAVNDRNGHDAGDLLLIAVANRLRENVRRPDFIARLGGDEFVIVAEGFIGSTAAQQFGQNLMTAFSVPFILPRGLTCIVGVTIGYALAPQDGIDASHLLKRADTAMYNGKQSGKRCLRRDVALMDLAAA